MAKQIFSNFLGGLSYYDKNAPENTYYEGREIDPHRGLGYLKPGWATETIAKSDDDPVIVNDLIVDILVDHTTAQDCYFLDNSRVYHMTNYLSDTWDTDFDGSEHAYCEITGATRGESLFIYPTKIGGAAAANKLFYIYQDDFGMYDLSSVFDHDWGSTIPTGKGALQDAPHPTIEWQSFRWIGNGQYLAKFDGQTGDNGTIELTKLNLGQGWEITALFPTRNYIGICAWRKNVAGPGYRTESKVFFYDGTSTDYDYHIPIAENKILGAYNHNGVILLWMHGRDIAVTLARLIEDGTKKIRKLKTSIGGTVTPFVNVYKNAIDNFGNRVIFGSEYLIWSYGGEEEGQPNAITIPWGFAGATNDVIGALSTVGHNRVFVSWTDATNGKYYLSKAVTGNSTRATYRGNYTDFGQKIRINYIKFYFKPLITSDSVTVSLDTDYGTANVLGTITEATDGAITTKRFNKIINCHSFRPVISWTTGGVAFSKVVVDYDFVGDL